MLHRRLNDRWWCVGGRDAVTFVSSEMPVQPWRLQSATTSRLAVIAAGRASPGVEEVLDVDDVIADDECCLQPVGVEMLWLCGYFAHLGAGDA